MRIASVILDIDTQALDSMYSYLVEDSLYSVAIGCVVLVPFGRKMDIGFVMRLEEYRNDSEIPLEKLKAIKEVLSRPLFNEDAVQCVEFLAKRYLAPLSRCVKLFTPPKGIPRIKRNGYAYKIEQPLVGEVDDRWVVCQKDSLFIPKPNAIKQKAILEALKNGELRVAELRAEYGSVTAPLKALEKNGAIRIEHRRRVRGGVHNLSPHDAEEVKIQFTNIAKPVLTQGQQEALDTIRLAYVAHAGNVVVVDGVTGSGKTEVYLRAIEDVLLDGKTAIVLVPEISLTPQTVARFRGRFGDMVAVLHSRMSDGERYDQWDYIRSGAARVVVGARSALFAPLRKIGLIIIDEEHESSYKQDSAPRYVSRDIAEWMAKYHGACLVLGSATPSIEALYKVAKNEKWQRAILSERANGKEMPRIEVVDMAKEFSGGSRSMFSRRLTEELKSALLLGHKAVLLLNQRGFAKFMLCRSCGYVPTCPNCSTSLTYHEKGHELMCHHCGHHEYAPAQCPQCKSPYLKLFGAGTQRVEAELHALITTFDGVHAPVIRMDADTTSKKGAHQELLEEFAAAESAVLLGTQMIAKGLDFDDVVLVGVINADTQLRLPDFRASERTFNLIEQVAGRAGRANLDGLVIVQSYQAQAVPIVAAANYDRAFFLKDELPKRKTLSYPPYVRLANILIWGKSESTVKSEAKDLYSQLEEYIEERQFVEWILLPPTPCVLAKLNNSYRYHITLKTPLDASIGESLEALFRSRRSSKDVHVSIDIDPTSLL